MQSAPVVRQPADIEVGVRRAMLAGLCASLVGIGLARFAYTPLIPVLVTEQWFDPAQAAYLGAANLAGYLAGALSAPAHDRGRAGDGGAARDDVVGDRVVLRLRLSALLLLVLRLALCGGRIGRRADGTRRARGAAARPGLPPRLGRWRDFHRCRARHRGVGDIGSGPARISASPRPGKPSAFSHLRSHCSPGQVGQKRPAVLPPS